MNILFISIAWPQYGGRNLYTDLMEEFVKHNHRVIVIGTHNLKRHSTTYSEENGILVYRLYSGKIRKTNYFQKIASLFAIDFRILHVFKKYISKDKIDLIIAPTPPITLSLLIKKLKRKFNASVYLLLKDIWPQGSVDLKVFRKYSIPWIYFRIHEKRFYRIADFIGCMSPLGQKYIIANNNYISANKVEVCPNCIRPTFEFNHNNNVDIRSKYGIPRDACVFIFSGNLGIGHGLDFLIETIRLLSDYSKAFFVVGGSGTQFKNLKRKLGKLLGANYFLYEWLPKEEYDQLLASSDVGLILLHKYTSPQFPSRLLSYLDHSKPVLSAISKGTDIGNIIVENGCGFSTFHGNITEFISLIRLFAENKETRIEMGKKARKLLLENYTVELGYKVIFNHFQNHNVTDEKGQK